MISKECVIDILPDTASVCSWPQASLRMSLPRSASTTLGTSSSSSSP